MRKACVVLVLLFLGLFWFPVVYADRGMISVLPDVSVYEPGQKAIVAWDGRVEILILSTDVSASVETLVLEILPLPSEPVVEAASFQYLKTLTEEKLQSIFEYKGWDGKTKRNKIEDILMHVIEEEIHHRGELLCIYWQNDITPPYTSYTGYVDYTSQV